MRRVNVTSALLVAVASVLVPAAVYAQSAIVGVVKDNTGAVLPGVTVEAASDVLIEKVKTVTTDGSGQYRIIDLRPGTYIVSYTLAGFQTVRREGIQLPAEFTATISVELRIGELAETITVTGASPIVDTTTAVHTQVLDRELIDAVPTGRTMQGIGQLIPGINLNLPDTGGARAMQQTYMSTHGMTTANNTVMVDGMMINGLQGDGAIQTYFNDALNAEVSYQTAGIGADTSAGGVRLNMIPREGGNRFSGDFKFVHKPGEWQSSNITERHRAANLSTGNAIERIVDATFSQGGPIMKNRLWFFASARYNSANNYIANTQFDDGSQGIDDQYIRQASARLTWQISPRNKLSGYFDEIDKYRGHDMQSLVDPETAALQWFSPAYHTAQAKFTSTLSSRLLFEGGWSSNIEYYTNSYQEGVEQPRFTPDWYAGASRLENGLGGRKTAATSQITQSPERQNMQASLSYVTGAHHLKTGFNYTWGDFIHTVDANADLTQQYQSTAASGGPYTVPNSVVVRNTPLVYGERLNHDFGIYIQDSWTMKRLTINGGLRWEHLKAQVLAGKSPAGRFAPERTFDEIENVPNWSDWAPRFQMVYDLFGTGKTALKYSLNRYNQARTTGIAADYNPLVSATVTLPWRDVNANDIADGERGCTGYPRVGCEIDFTNLSPNFGIAALNEYGDYPRTWNLESGLELQHEIMPRLSGSVAWFRGAFRNLTTTINRSWVADGDPAANPNFTPYTFYNPTTGEPIQVYARALQNRPTLNLDTFDPERERSYESYNFEFRGRPGWGITLFGGFSFERQLEVTCTAPDDPNTLRLCDDHQNNIPYRKNFVMSGNVQLPFQINLSAAIQSKHGQISTRNMAVTRGTTVYPATCPAPCPAGQVIMPTSVFGQTSLTVQLVDQDSVFTERVNQFDLKISRTFRFGGLTVMPTFEAYNLNNSDAIISYVSTSAISTSYLRPNSIMQSRFYGLGFVTRW